MFISMQVFLAKSSIMLKYVFHSPPLRPQPMWDSIPTDWIFNVLRWSTHCLHQCRLFSRVWYHIYLSNVTHSWNSIATQITWHSTHSCNDVIHSIAIYTINVLINVTNNLNIFMAKIKGEIESYIIIHRNHNILGTHLIKFISIWTCA
jgi:hypothetical protein